MRKKYIIKLFILSIFIAFIFTCLSFSSFEIAMAKETDIEGNFIYGDYFLTGNIIEVLSENKQVKVNIGRKDGLDEEKLKKNSKFTVLRQAVPVAILKLDSNNINYEYSLFSVENILDGITLQEGDQVTSEENLLDPADLVFIDNQYCELGSKSWLGSGMARWSAQHHYIDLLGDTYIFVSYHNPDFTSSSEEGMPFFIGGEEVTRIYFFDDNGERLWGYNFPDYCFYPEFDVEPKIFASWRLIIPDSGPPYEIFGDKMFFNGYNISYDAWVPFKFVKSGGMFFCITLKTGEALWALKDGETWWDPAFLEIIYDNIGDIGYLYSGEESIIAVNLLNGMEIWRFEKNSEASERSIFELKEGYIYANDDDGYLYKINAENGNKIWEISSGGEIVRIQFPESDKNLYLFDDSRSIYSIDSENGKIIWEYRAEQKFTSPEANQIDGDLIYTFDEDGIGALSKDTGEEISRIKIKKPVPEYFEENICYCISDKKNLACVDITGGKIFWSFNAHEKILKIVSLKDAIYVLDEKNVYALEKNTGKELWKKEDFSDPVYLEHYKSGLDPYNILNLGKIDDVEKLVFIVGKKGFISINPDTHEIVGDVSFNGDTFFAAIGDVNKFYIASKKHLWTLAADTGLILWDKAFEDEIEFITKPEDGDHYLSQEEYNSRMNSIISRSKKLIGIDAGEMYFVLDKENGEVISQGSEKEFIYPYLEVEAMNKIGERVSGLLLYCYKGKLYTVKSKL